MPCLADEIGTSTIDAFRSVFSLEVRHMRQLLSALLCTAAALLISVAPLAAQDCTGTSGSATISSTASAPAAQADRRVAVPQEQELGTKPQRPAPAGLRVVHDPPTGAPETVITVCTVSVPVLYLRRLPVFMRFITLTSRRSSSG